MKIKRKKIKIMTAQSRSIYEQQVASNVAVIHPDNLGAWLADLNAELQAEADEMEALRDQHNDEVNAQVLGIVFPDCPRCQDTNVRPFGTGWYCGCCGHIWDDEPVVTLPPAEVEQAENWLAGVSRFAKALGGDYETAITVATAIERSVRA